MERASDSASQPSCPPRSRKPLGLQPSGGSLKGAPKAEILRAIRSVVNGEAIFGPVIAKRLMQFFATNQPVAPAKLFPELTDREREILALIAQHYKNPEIAERLSLSQKTVRNHISNIFDKMQVTDRAQAILKARDAALK
jgi:DNA-binding NarL/FixJ family response regulator